MELASAYARITKAADKLLSKNVNKLLKLD
jgi:hypothetical protein